MTPHGEVKNVYETFFPVLFSSHHYPSGGPYCITVPFVLAYIQSSPELRRWLSLVTDIVISCIVVAVVLPSRVPNHSESLFIWTTFPYHSVELVTTAF